LNFYHFFLEQSSPKKLRQQVPVAGVKQLVKAARDEIFFVSIVFTVPTTSRHLSTDRVHILFSMQTGKRLSMDTRLRPPSFVNGLISVS
jgi:hypothetical protein